MGQGFRGHPRAPHPQVQGPHCGRTALPRGIVLVLIQDSWKLSKDQKSKLKKKWAKNIYFISFHAPKYSLAPASP